MYYQQIFGNNNVATTAATRFLQPGWGIGQATTTTIELRSPDKTTIWRNLQVRARVAGAGSNVVSYTLVVNGAATTLVAAGLPTLQDWSNFTVAVTVPARALVSLQVTKAGAITTSPLDIVASVEVYASPT